MSQIISEEAINMLIKVSKQNESHLVDNLVQAFKADTPRRIDQINKAASVYFSVPVVQAAKSIRLCASQLGIGRLVDICNLLETYDGSCYNSEQICAITAEMRQIYSQACEYLESRLQPQPDDISRYF